MSNQEFNSQNIFKRESSKIVDTYLFPSKIVNFFLHTKQESSKTTVANEGSIKIDRRVLTPKSSRSRISSKSCSSLAVSLSRAWEFGILKLNITNPEPLYWKVCDYYAVCVCNTV